MFREYFLWCFASTVVVFSIFFFSLVLVMYNTIYVFRKTNEFKRIVQIYIYINSNTNQSETNPYQWIIWMCVLLGVYCGSGFRIPDNAETYILYLCTSPSFTPSPRAHLLQWCHSRFSCLRRFFLAKYAPRLLWNGNWSCRAGRNKCDPELITREVNFSTCFLCHPTSSFSSSPIVASWVSPRFTISSPHHQEWLL